MVGGGHEDVDIGGGVGVRMGLVPGRRRLGALVWAISGRESATAGAICWGSGGYGFLAASLVV